MNISFAPIRLFLSVFKICYLTQGICWYWVQICSLFWDFKYFLAAWNSLESFSCKLTWGCSCKTQLLHWTVNVHTPTCLFIFELYYRFMRLCYYSDHSLIFLPVPPAGQTVTYLMKYLNTYILYGLAPNFVQAFMLLSGWFIMTLVVLILFSAC